MGVCVFKNKWVSLRRISKARVSIYHQDSFSTYPGNKSFLFRPYNEYAALAQKFCVLYWYHCSSPSRLSPMYASSVSSMPHSDHTHPEEWSLIQNLSYDSSVSSTSPGDGDSFFCNRWKEVVRVLPQTLVIGTMAKKNESSNCFSGSIMWLIPRNYLHSVSLWKKEKMVPLARPIDIVLASISCLVFAAKKNHVSNLGSNGSCCLIFWRLGLKCHMTW